MFAAAGIILISILCVSHLYLKSSAPRSFTSVISAVIAVIAALGYYEIASNILISRSIGGQWVQPVVFAGIFIAVLAATKVLADFVLPQNVDFGQLPAHLTAVVCGIIAGIIISGALFIAVALCPLDLKWPYARFEDNNINISSPKRSLLNSDGIVAGLFGWISRGSLSSGKSFAVYHANFIDQLHLNRHKAKEGVYMIAAAEAVVLPEKNAVRIFDVDRRSYTFVRMGLRAGEIDRGGAMDKQGGISFTPSQVRLLCKPKDQAGEMSGTAHPVYPEGRLLDDELVELQLSETISISRGGFETFSRYGRVGWVDIAFSVPADMTPILLEFKQNTVVSLPKPVIGDAETEVFPGTEEDESEQAEYYDQYEEEAEEDRRGRRER
ncbi:MAG TPA: hypothetical protein HPP87_05055 [Planctomycetes bacterium]|nr:hypothetical protein [Planctomycetota bacterium]